MSLSSIEESELVMPFLQGLLNDPSLSSIEESEQTSGSVASASVLPSLSSIEESELVRAAGFEPSEQCPYRP